MQDSLLFVPSFLLLHYVIEKIRFGISQLIEMINFREEICWEKFKLILIDKERKKIKSNFCSCSSPGRYLPFLQNGLDCEKARMSIADPKRK